LWISKYFDIIQLYCPGNIVNIRELKTCENMLPVAQNLWKHASSSSKLVKTSFLMLYCVDIRLIFCFCLENYRFSLKYSYDCSQCSEKSFEWSKEDRWSHICFDWCRINKTPLPQKTADAAFDVTDTLWSGTLSQH